MHGIELYSSWDWPAGSSWYGRPNPEDRIKRKPKCLVPTPRKLNNSWTAADLSYLLSVDEIMHKLHYFIIWSNGQIWSFGSVIWLRIFGRPVSVLLTHLCWSTYLYKKLYFLLKQVNCSKEVILCKDKTCWTDIKVYLNKCHLNIRWPDKVVL